MSIAVWAYLIGCCLACNNDGYCQAISRLSLALSLNSHYLAPKKNPPITPHPQEFGKKGKVELMLMDSSDLFSFHGIG